MAKIIPQPINGIYYNVPWNDVEVDFSSINPDDLFEGFFSKQLFKWKDRKKASCILPQAPGFHWDGPGYEPYRKIHHLAFQESEYNCNTYKHLSRLPSDGKPLKGKCLKKDIQISFYPEDCMHFYNNECFEQR